MTRRMVQRGAFLLMAVLAAHAADRRGWGLRGEALLLLCLILPQGFLTAGSAPQVDVLGALLLVAALVSVPSRRSTPGSCPRTTSLMLNTSSWLNRM